MQGTIYPTVIESCPPLSDESTGKEISPSQGNSLENKSHHNVGELPAIMRLKTVEPLKWLLKDEDRKLGGFLGIPQWFLNLHPFPRPGLAIRILGDVTHNDALETLRQVDEIFITCIWEAHPYPQDVAGVCEEWRVSGSKVINAFSSTPLLSERSRVKMTWLPTGTISMGSFFADVSSKICNNV